MSALSLGSRSLNGFLFVFAGLLAAAALAGPGAAQSTWYVDVNATPPGDGSASSPYADLQYCIAQGTTLPGDLVLVLPGVYSGNVDYLGKELVIESTAGAGSTWIRTSSGSGVRVASGEGAGTTLRGFTVDGGTGELDGTDRLGGGIFCRGATISIEECTIRQNEATRGAGIYADEFADLFVKDCLIEENDADIAGGGIHADSTDLTVESSVIRENTAGGTMFNTGGGGGMWITDGAWTMFDSEITDNSAPEPYAQAGGVYCSLDTALVEDCTFVGNLCGHSYSSGTMGGGLRCMGGPNTVFTRCSFIGNVSFNGEGGGILGAGRFEFCLIQDNIAVMGGGVQATTNPGALVMKRSLVTGNSAYPHSGECSGEGGGVRRGTYEECSITDNYSTTVGGGASEATLTDCLVEGNYTGACDGTVGGGGVAGCTATRCTIRGNQVRFSNNYWMYGIMGGGGAHTSTLSSCTVAGNSAMVTTYADPGATMWGGGTFDCSLDDCVIEGNLCQDKSEAGSKGGGVYGGTATGCTIQNNRAVRDHPVPSFAMGGGAAEAELTRCVILGNEADRGGAAWSSTLTNCTLGENLAHLSGGAVSGAPPDSFGGPTSSELTNCILWNNVPDEAAPDGGTLDIRYSDVAGGSAGTGNISADPLFWNLAAGDVHLRDGSPCIDAGDPSSPPDLDGSIVDMGALVFDVGYWAEPYAYCTAKPNSQGCVPAVGYTGTPSAGGSDDFHALAGNLINNTPGILIWSAAPAETPFYGGMLCLAHPIVRTPVTFSGGTAPPTVDCSGELSFFFSQSYLLSTGLNPGDRVFAQFWYRDPAHTDGTGVGLSDALDFTISP